MEDYLEAVLVCSADEGHAHTKEIAESLNVRMASVTSAIQTLATQGLVHYERYGPVTLTTRGEKLAQSLFDRHQVLKRYMRDMLGLSEAVADANACRMEHVMDPEVVKRIATHLDFVLSCPVHACVWQAGRQSFCSECDDPSECKKQSASLPAPRG